MSKQEALDRYDRRIGKEIASLPWYAIYTKDKIITFAAIVRAELSELWDIVEEIKDEHTTR